MIQIPIFNEESCVWKIYLLANSEKDCELRDFLRNPSVLPDWERLQAKLEKIAKSKEGLGVYGDRISHELGSKKYKIFRFSQGSLRISWFYGKGNKIILCAHGYLKKTNATSRSDIAKAESYYEKYYNDIAG